MSTPEKIADAGARLRISVERELDLDVELRVTIDRTPGPPVAPTVDSISNRSSSAWLVAACFVLLAAGVVGLLVTRNGDTTQVDQPPSPSVTTPVDVVDDSTTGRLTLVASIDGGSSSASEALSMMFADVDVQPETDEGDGQVKFVVDGVTLAAVSDLVVEQMSIGFDVRPVLNPGDEGQQVTGPDGATMTVGPWDSPPDLFTDVVVFEIQGFGLELELGDEANWNSLARQCFERGPACPTGQIALLLGSKVVSAPTVNAPSFAETITVSGDFSLDEVRELAAHAVPYAITNIEATWTPPTGEARAVTITLRP